MIKQTSEAPTNGAPPVPNRLAMNRPRGTEGIGTAAAARHEEGPGAEWTRPTIFPRTAFPPRNWRRIRHAARTMARAQAVAEKLSAATDLVSSANRRSLWRRSKNSKRRCTPSPPAPTRRRARRKSPVPPSTRSRRLSTLANGRADASLKRVNELAVALQLHHVGYRRPEQGSRRTLAEANLESPK